MIETPDLLHQLPAIILAGLCTYIWLVARDRRKALERYIEAHVESDACRCIAYSPRLLRFPRQDAVDRTIAASVKRVTKEKHES